MRRVGSCLLSLVFLVVGLIPNLTHPSPAYAQTAFAPPLPFAEDPLGQQPEQQLPEISIDVDVRDGHLTARVVDIWGPGGVPLVMRSYTNAQPSEPGPTASGEGAPPVPNSGPFRWQFNHNLNVLGAEVLEPDGNRSSFRYSHDRWSADNLHLWQVYVKDVGTYATMELHYTCPTPPEPPCPTCRPESKPPGGGSKVKVRPAPRAPAGTRIRNNIQSVPSNCSWDGWHTVFLPKGRIRKFSSGLIAEERDANGNVATFTHTSFPDGVGTYLARVTDPVGRATNYSYERAYLVCVRSSFSKEADWICTGTAWVYRLRTVTDPYGRTATYSYDGNTLKITSVTNAAGHITQHTYTAGGLLASITSPRGVGFTTTLDWTTGPDGTPRVARVTAPGGSATNYAYTHASTAPYRVIRTVVTNARSHATTYEMNSGDIEKATDPMANVTQFAYDTRHNVTRVTDPRNNQATYQYNDRNKVTQIVQAAGLGAGFLNLTTTLSWDNDNLLSVTNPRGIRTEYTYNATHNLTRVRRAVGTPDESVTAYTPMTWGRVASITDPRGHTTTFGYTARRQLQTVTPPGGGGGATTYGYDILDDQVTITNGNNRRWTTTYNGSRLVTSITDPLNHVVRHEYDANGSRTRMTDARNYITTFEYDNRDRLTSITDPMSGVTRYGYDAVNNLIRTTNTRNYATTFDYDGANRLTRVTDALGQVTTYGYDPASNLTSMQDRRTNIQTYTYDQVNRLTKVTVGSFTVTHEYDANSNRTSLIDGGGTTTFTYDFLDRLTRRTTPDNRSVQYGYDASGNRTRLTYPDGTTTLIYGYDPGKRLAQITQGTLTWTLSYDLAGNRTEVQRPNGTRTEYTYQTNNWLQTITHKRPDASTFQFFNYGYDANGNRTSQADDSGTTTFTYDPLNRLSGATYPGAYGNWSWTYDPAGNRATQTAPSGTTTYTYDANNRLSQAGTVTYNYDPNGNLLSTSAGQSFTWDPFNRLTNASGPGGAVTYTYNGDGLKIRRTGPDGATVYYYDGILPIWEADGTGTPKAQLDRDIFGNLLSRREASGVRRHFAHDGLGGLTGVTDEVGTHVASLLYDAWGNVRATSGTWGAGNYRFTGAEFDQATGLYHMGARFYDPNLGRWLSEDPVRMSGPRTLNFYAYVGSNPLAFTDLSGMCDQQCLEDLNARRQALARRTSDPSEYIAAREVARSLEATVGRDIAYEVAGTFLDKIKAGVDPGTALQEALDEILRGTSAGPAGPMKPQDIRRLVEGLYTVSVVYLGLGAFTDLVSVLFSTANFRQWVRDTYPGWPITEIGVWAFIAAALLDHAYFQFDVLGRLLCKITKC